MISPPLHPTAKPEIEESLDPHLSVRLWWEEGQFRVQCPYHLWFLRETVCRLRATWRKGDRSWAFNATHETSVRTEILRLFGTDGTVPIPTSDAIVTLGGPDGISQATQEVVVFGRTLVSRALRDSRVSLWKNVSLMSGPSFAGEGGSRKYPEVGTDHVVRELQVHSVPTATLHEEMRRFPKAIREFGPRERRIQSLLERRNTLLGMLREAQQELDNLGYADPSQSVRDPDRTPEEVVAAILPKTD